MAKTLKPMRPGQKVADWDAAFEEFLALKRSTGLNQRGYADKLGVAYDYVCTQFAEIRRKRYELEVRNKLPRVMAEALRQVDASIKSNETDIELDTKHKQHYALDAFKAIADRAGFSPQAVTVQVSQTNQQAVMMPPIFAQSYATEADKMLKGTDAPKADD